SLRGSGNLIRVHSGRRRIESRTDGDRSLHGRVALLSADARAARWLRRVRDRRRGLARRAARLSAGRSGSEARARGARGMTAAIAAGHPATVEAGVEILQVGGSAADAAVAASLAACVA